MNTPEETPSISCGPRSFNRVISGWWSVSCPCLSCYPVCHQLGARFGKGYKMGFPVIEPEEFQFVIIILYLYPEQPLTAFIESLFSPIQDLALIRAGNPSQKVFYGWYAGPVFIPERSKIEEVKDCIKALFWQAVRPSWDLHPWDGQRHGECLELFDWRIFR